MLRICQRFFRQERKLHMTCRTYQLFFYNVTMYFLPLLFQHQNYKTNIWLTQHIFAKQYLSLYHLQFARFFTQKTPNSIPAALAVAALSVHAESKDDEVITDDLMSNHKQDLDFVKSLIEVEPVVEFLVQNTSQNTLRRLLKLKVSMYINY